LLLKEGANMNIKDPAGKTPADWCAERETLDHWNDMLADLGKQFSKRPSRPFDKVIRFNFRM
jgi:hypothetical protein